MQLDTDFQLAGIVGGEPFAFERREGPHGWTVTASHAVSYYGSDHGCVGDRGTGGLALLLHELTGVRALMTSGHWPIDADAEPLAFCPFKRMLVDDACPTVVVDLHSHTGRDLLVDRGVKPDLAAAAYDRLAEFALGSGIDLRQHNTPATDGRCRVLDVLAGIGVPALRLSIGSDLLDPWTDPARAEQLVLVLCGLLNS